MSTSTGRVRASLRVRLLGLALVGATGVAAVTAIGVRELEHVAEAEAHADVFESGVDGYHQVEAARAGLHAQVLLGSAAGVAVAGERYLWLVQQQLGRPLPGEHREAALGVAVHARELVEVGSTAPVDRAAFARSLQVATDAESAAQLALEEAAEGVEEQAGDVRAAAQRALAVVGVASAAVLLGLTLLLSMLVVRSLQRIRRVATAVSAGDLSARTGVVADDEVGQVAHALDTMADALQELLDAQREEVRQQEFVASLGAALDHADDRAAVLAITERALDLTGHDGPAELLLADSSQAHLDVQAASPRSGPAGCSVSAPRGCPAVRSGVPVVMGDAHALDACPRLQERSDRLGSAVCAPVTFMGRALGVLHAASPEPGEPAPEVVARLRSLASQVSGRLGTVDALARAELQAGTDVLTGLRNRRSTEEVLGRLAAAGRPYGLLLVDLDHFKRINDVHGHDAGDRALRVFASVVPRALRPDDVVGRWGGEEFLVVLPDATARAAAEAGQRLRAVLAEALDDHACPRFTVSSGAADSFSAPSVEEQVARADEALLAAKAAGRDRVVVAGLTAGAAPTALGSELPRPAPATA